MAIQLGSAYGKVSLDIKGLLNGVKDGRLGLSSLSEAAKKMGADIKRIGAAMTVGLTLPLLAVGKSAFDVFRTFEQSLNVLQTVSGATEEEMKKLSDRARELGADLTLPGTSAADAADAMAELAKAGLKVNEILAASRGVLQLSVAGQMSNAEAARITANALNAFKLSGEDAGRVADMLAAAALASTAEVKEMADSLQMSGAVASMTGIKIESLITSIALLSNAGIQGSDAGTSFKQMLLSLQTPSRNAKVELNKYGIEIYDAAGNMKNMRDLIIEFTSKLKGATQEQRNLALGTIFGSDAIRAANILLLGGVDAYDKMSESVNKTGAAAGLAASMMKGLTGSIENIKSAYETAAISAIEPFKDSLKVLLDTVAKALNAFAALPKGVRMAIVIFLALVAVIGPLLVVLGSLLPMLGGITRSFNPLSGGILGLVFNFAKLVAAAAIVVNVLTYLGISTGAVGAGILGLNTAIVGVGASILSVVGPILIVIAAVGLLYWAWKRNLFGIQDLVHKSAEGYKLAWGRFTEWLKENSAEASESVHATFAQLPTKIQNSFQNAWSNFVSWLRNALSNMRTYLSNAFSNVNWGQIGKNILLGLANGMLLGIPNLIAAATKAVKTILDTFDKGLDSHSPSRKLMQRGVWSAQGYMMGWQQTMSSDALFKSMAKPILNNSSSQSQTINNYFPTGLSTHQVRAVVDDRIDALMGTMITALGNA